MNIELYPKFTEVFEDDSLKGVFYPLCKISLNSYSNPLYFVSSHGIWTNKNIQNEHNQSNFTCFQIKNGKYDFKGDLNVYIGYQQAQSIIEILEIDFLKHGTKYLSQKVKTQSYIQIIKENYQLHFGELDTDYFLQTFYEFSINKLNYKQHGEFSTFRQIMDKWHKIDESPIVYEIKNDNSSGYADLEANKSYLFPKTLDIKKYKKVGFIAGNEFFTDGHDIYLVFDKNSYRAICIHHYS